MKGRDSRGYTYSTVTLPTFLLLFSRVSPSSQLPFQVFPNFKPKKVPSGFSITRATVFVTFSSWHPIITMPGLCATPRCTPSPTPNRSVAPTPTLFNLVHIFRFISFVIHFFFYPEPSFQCNFPWWESIKGIFQAYEQVNYFLKLIFTIISGKKLIRRKK